MKILVTICARGGSKGIPGKNVRVLNGKHLIAYSIQVAQKFCKKYDACLTLSTDSTEIKDVAAKYGLVTEYTRPQDLATDRAGKIITIHDVLLFEEKQKKVSFDYILDLDVTSPLRNLNDLEEAFRMIRENPDALNIFSVSPPNRNPYFNMIEPKNDGYCKLVKDGLVIKSRQQAPVVYDMNASFYFYRRRFFDEGWETAITNKSMYYLVPHTCFDLDNPIDFTLMELMLREKLLDFDMI
jgi:CMP-N,N'-diacetyllegionaminic acid synthase